MSDFDWKSLVGTVAPGLATALGGPAAGLAVKLIADKLLKRPDATEAEVAEELSRGSLTGEQLLALKAAEQSYELELVRLQQASEAASMQDTADARKQTIALAEAGSSIAWGAAVVSVIIVVGYFSCIALLFFRGEDMPENVFQLTNMMFGVLTLAFGSVVSYWLGSSAGSKRAGDALRYIAQKKG